VSRTTTPSPHLQADFASSLPELSIPWQAAEVAEPHLLLLNDQLAAELGLDSDWLREPEGVRFLVGNHVPEGASPVAHGWGTGAPCCSASSRTGTGSCAMCT
jgi:serine/tyrosine/threonine adenylyltransferase